MNNSKGFKYTYPDQMDNFPIKPKIKDSKDRYSEDVLIIDKETQDKSPHYKRSPNKEPKKIEPKKSFEDKPKQNYQEGRKSDNNVGKPGSISEIIDSQKVKSSKLFQKFLQNENKENPKNTSRQSLSPPKQDPREQPKSRTPGPAPSSGPSVSGNQAAKKSQSRFARQEDHEGSDYLRERNTPNYEETARNSIQYIKDNSMEREGPKQASYKREQDMYDDDLDGRNQGVNLNFQSSSKMVSLQYPEFPQSISSLHNVSQSIPVAPPNMYSFLDVGEKMRNQHIQQQQQMQVSNEIMLLRSQLVEMSQTLSKEVEEKKILESRCEEIQMQFEKLAQSTQGSQQKTLDREGEYQEAARKAEEKLRSLNETLIEKTKAEEQHLMEINKLKKKIDAELESRGRLLEEHDELERKKYEETERMNAELKEKEAEIQRLKRDSDTSRHDKDSFRALEEKLLREIKSLKSEIMDLNRTVDDLRKTCDDKHQQINLGEIENSSLRDQLDGMEAQYRDLLADNDRVKRENFGLKERLLSAESEIKTLQLTLDKAEIDANQAAEALTRTEKALERERKLTSELRIQVSSEQRERSMNRQYTATANKYQEEEDQPYYLKGSGPKVKFEQDSYQPTKHDRKQESMNQEEDDSRYQYKRRGSGRGVQQQMSYDERDSYSKETVKMGRKDESIYTRMGKRTDEQTQAPSENKYEERYNRRGYGKSSTMDNKDFSYNELEQAKQKTTVQAPSENKYEERYSRGRRETGKSSTMDNRDFSHNEFEKAKPKMSIQNQLYKPTNNLLSWGEDTGNQNVNTRGRENRMEHSPPTRGKSQMRQENDNNGRKSSPPHLQTQNFIREDIAPPNSQKVHGLEMDLMNLQMRKDNLINELQRLDKVKIKSGATIKRKQEIDGEMESVQGQISNIKTRLREMGALHI